MVSVAYPWLCGVRKQFVTLNMAGTPMWPGGPDLWDMEAVMKRCYEIKAYMMGLNESDHSE